MYKNLKINLLPLIFFFCILQQSKQKIRFTGKKSQLQREFQQTLNVEDLIAYIHYLVLQASHIKFKTLKVF